MTTAVVVGGGPNGLAAGLQLARHGVEVTVLEAADEVGGGSKSGALGVPGLIHDYCAAFHPLGVGSPVWAQADLAKYGLAWAWPEIDCAHPLDDGATGLLYRSLEQTAAGLGVDGRRWELLFGDLVSGFDQMAPDLLRPIVNVPRHPFRLAAFGPRAILPATWLARAFKTETARALFGGVAAHAFNRLDLPLTASLGMMITASGHRFGWPVAVGGSGSIIAAVSAAFADAGGRIETGVTISGRHQIPDADIVMLDLSAAQTLALYGDAMPARIAKAYGRYKVGSSAFKVDFAIRGDIPWRDPAAGRAGTVHLGGSLAEVAYTEKQRAAGIMVDNPFVLLGQQYVADPSRSNGELNPVYAYAHVPKGYDGEATEAVIGQIERFAPGFRDRIEWSASRGAVGLEEYNANYAAGDIIGGANTGLQMLLRPRPAVDPYATGVDGVYLCSQSAPPGAGVHGLCGFHAANSALKKSGITPGARRRR